MSSRRVKVEIDLPLTEVKNLSFGGKTIKLNGYHFINCRFANCILWADQALFILDCCYFVDCQILEAPPAESEAVN